MSDETQGVAFTEPKPHEGSTLGHNAVIAGSRLERWLTCTYTDKGKKWPPIIWAVDVSRHNGTELVEIFGKIGPGNRFVLIPLTNPHLRDYELNSVMIDYLITLCAGRGTRTNRDLLDAICRPDRIATSMQPTAT